MMRRFAFLTLVSLSFAVAALASAGTAVSAMHAQPQADGDTFSFAGKVTLVDYAANVVFMTSNGKRVSIVIEPTTAIDVNGEPGGIGDIRPGVRLRADGVIRAGRLVAQSISVQAEAPR